MATVKDNRRRGWFWCADAIIDTYGSILGPAGIAVYACLARRADANGQCWPGKERIAADLNIGVRLVRYKLQQLEALRLIAITHRTTSAGSLDTNLYILLEPPVTPAVSESQAQMEEDPDLLSPSMDSPLTVFPLGACGAPPLVQVVHDPRALSAPGSACGAPPPLIATPRGDLPADRIWDQTRQYLRLQTSQNIYKTWIAPSEYLSHEGDTFTAKAPNDQAREWFEKRIPAKINTALSAVLGRPATVRWAP